MDDSKKERLLMMIVSVSAIACIMENYIAKWEAWVPPLILFGLAGIWWLHITGRIEAELRATVYFIYTAFVVFYFGVHPDMIFDISVVIMLFMATFSMLDSKKILNCIVIEYMILAISQGYLSSANGEMTMDALMIMKALLHTGSVITLYMFLTGKGDKDSIMRVLSLKPAGYLLKTIERKDLRENIAGFFAKQMMEQH